LTKRRNGLNELEPSQGVHLVAVKALAKITQQKKEKSSAATCDFCPCKIGFGATHILTVVRRSLEDGEHTTVT